MTTLFAIVDHGYVNHPADAETIQRTLGGMQPGVRARVLVAEVTVALGVPANEWLDRMRRAEAQTIPPAAVGDEEVTLVTGVPNV